MASEYGAVGRMRAQVPFRREGVGREEKTKRFLKKKKNLRTEFLPQTLRKEKEKGEK